MTRRHLAIVLAFCLTACQSPPVENAPSYTVSTVTADLPEPLGLAASGDSLAIATPRGILHMGPDEPLSTLAAGAPLKAPAALAWRDSTLLAADPPSNRIWRIPLSEGPPTAFAGTGTALVPIGDGGVATSAQLNAPSDVAFGPDGSTFVADAGNKRIRRIDSDGRISTVAGTEEAFDKPVAVAAAPDGRLWVIDAGKNTLSRVSPDGKVETVARDLADPRDVIATAGGALVTEAGKDRVIWVSPSGRVVPVVGGGTENEEGAGTAIALTEPRQLTPAGGDRLYLLDGNRILLLTPAATP